MRIQSCSFVIPNKKCINNCKFCVSRMHTEDYPNKMNLPLSEFYENEIIRRLEFVRDNGCNTLILTGNSEPQQNLSLLAKIGNINKKLSKPFRCIEIQTTGILLNSSKLLFLRNHVGVTTISLSLSSFDSIHNARIIGSSEYTHVELIKFCKEINDIELNLRLSINLTNEFDCYLGNVKKLFLDAKQWFHPHQITFRTLYMSENDTEQDRWIKQNKCSDFLIREIQDYIKTNGKYLGKLEYGLNKYSVDEISTVLDDDSMASHTQDVLKYIILRPDCKLYAKWDDKGSLIF